MDIHDPMARGVGINPVNKIRGKHPHEAGQNQQIHIIGFNIVQKLPFGNDPGFYKKQGFFTILFHIHQSLFSKNHVKVKIFGKQAVNIPCLATIGNDPGIIHHKRVNTCFFCPRQAFHAVNV